MDSGLPRWKEEQEVVRYARAESAPGGPSGILYLVYKGVPDILHYQ